MLLASLAAVAGGAIDHVHVGDLQRRMPGAVEANGAARRDRRREIGAWPRLIVAAAQGDQGVRARPTWMIGRGRRSATEVADLGRSPSSLGFRIRKCVFAAKRDPPITGSRYCGALQICLQGGILIGADWDPTVR